MYQRCLKWMPYMALEIQHALLCKRNTIYMLHVWSCWFVGVILCSDLSSDPFQVLFGHGHLHPKQIQLSTI